MIWYDTQVKNSVNKSPISSLFKFNKKILAKIGRLYNEKLLKNLLRVSLMTSRFLGNRQLYITLTESCLSAFLHAESHNFISPKLVMVLT